MAYLAVALSAVMWGSWPLFLRPAGLPPLQCAFAVMVFCALPAPFTLRRAALRDRGATIALVLLGVSNSLNISCLFAAIHHGPVSVAIFTHYLAPVLVTLTAPWLIGETRSRRALVALPPILGGLLLVVGIPGGEFHGETALLGATSALGLAANMLTSKVAARSHSPLTVIAASSVVTAAILLAVFGRGVVPSLAMPGVAWLLAGAVIPGLAAGVIFTAGLKRIPAQVSGALCYLEPVSAALFGAAFLHEPLGMRGALGAALVVAMGVWVAREPPALQPTSCVSPH